MPLYDITTVQPGPHSSGLPKFESVSRTTFAAERVQERAHLQAALRDQIEVIDPNLFVIAEEFGEFDGANRRVDLLCVDRSCRLVVVELKRTSDGGHMELQALRYAAMVSTMTFKQVVATLARYRSARTGDEFSDADAETDILSWLGAEPGDDEPVVSREVGIVLASEDFGQEVTTTVLWLNEFYGFDIRCVRLRPYKFGDRLLLDVQQVIPLPEASLYTIRVRDKEVAARSSRNATGQDWTRFIVISNGTHSEPLPKRWAMLKLVQALAQSGVAMTAVQEVLPPSKLVRLEGVFETPEEVWTAVRAQHGKPDAKRWHIADPIHVGESTWVLHSNWGDRTREYFKTLVALAPTSGIRVVEEADKPPSTS